MRHILLTGLLFWNICFFLQEMGDKILVKLGKDIVLQSELDFNKTELEKTGEQQEDCSIFEGILLNKLMVQQSVIDSIIVTEAEIKAEIEMRMNYMMAQVGGKENFEQNIGKKPAEVRKFLYDPIRENLIAGRMRREILKNFKMTPQDVYDYYKKNEFNLPVIEEQVQLSQLIIQPEISKEIEQKLMNELNELRLDVQSEKMSMALAAALHSEDPGSQARGGVLGLLSREKFVPEFSAIAYKLQPGEISKVFKTKFGYHFLQVIERRGELINVAHVLKKPKSNLEDIQKSQLLADSIYQKIMEGELSFEQAVARYSTDTKTKNSVGLIQNIMDQSDIFTVNQVMQHAKSHPDIAYVRDIIFSFAGAEEESITYPSLVINSDQNRVIQIAKLNKRIASHSANLDLDYVLIEQLAKQNLEQEEIKKWANKMIKKNYIEMNSNYESCPFVYNWK